MAPSSYKHHMLGNAHPDRPYPRPVIPRPCGSGTIFNITMVMMKYIVGHWLMKTRSGNALVMFVVWFLLYVGTFGSPTAMSIQTEYPKLHPGE
ncbi:hypothetical protein B0I35DRAFT_254106 [Stachybotrys elegans]|uniref:Uncharacterized protein n=1 Tax=Stachybotrys elegans TaxID=80388 RepID=A0A8K0SSN9_9HYPO|nr:hypothetical protein B0I35DRAFT_254106 [Stachybotrys elegans]